MTDRLEVRCRACGAPNRILADGVYPRAVLAARLDALLARALG